LLLMLIDDINKALDNNCFFSALTLALTLPDICGKAEYPESKTSERYKKWYEEYIEKSEKYGVQALPYLSSNVVYSLRNYMLHQGTVYTDKINEFALIVEDKKEWNSLTEMGGVITDSHGNTTTRYSVNVRRLCFLLCTYAKTYYNNNREKFDFFSCRIIKYDDTMPQPFTQIYP